MKNRQSIYNLSYLELISLLDAWGEPKFRAQQIWQGMYQHSWDDFSKYTTLPLELRHKLANTFYSSGLLPVKTLLSLDRKTQKTLFQTPDQYLFETVLMRYDQRNTICVSTQVGCSMGCSFCATGQMGFKKNLSPGEIIEQVLFFQRQLQNDAQKVTNIVMMGMGEPFLNYENVMECIERLNDPQGFNFGKRRITISTVGIIPMIERFTLENSQVNLAVSLHAANDETRSELVPINKKYPLKPLMEACRRYISHTGRRISFEWALIDGINDRIEDVHQIASITKGMLVHFNIIPLNPTKGYPRIGSGRSRIHRFCQELSALNIPFTVRLRRGVDIQAGCGQLATAINQSS